MTHPNASTALARVVVDELADRGVEVVVIAPGSRSGALAIAAAAHDGLDTVVVVDERSAGFHSLGVARASGRASAVISTSGTAAANFYPALIEADMSCVPLVVITADRPAEMQGIGANQTIDQVGMFGAKVRASVNFEAPDEATDLNATWRTEVGRAVAAATYGRPGPVHINVRFREPTVPVSDDGRTVGVEYPFDTPRLAVAGQVPEPADPSDLPRLNAARGLIIAGDGRYDRDELAKRAASIGWPVLATAVSGMRGGDVVTTYHHLLGHGVPTEARPDTVVAVGAIGPSLRLENLVASAGHRVRIDAWGRRVDPGRNATDVLAGDVNDLLDRVDGVETGDWSARWLELGRDRLAGLRARLDESEVMTGAAVAVTLDQVDWGSLVVASSLPIREVDAHLTRSGQVLANRGASGIDGFVSTALGAASRIPRTVAFAGDLSLLHDSNGFINDASIDLTLVVVDNGGGGLFDSLPQARHAPDYERLFVTDPHRDLSVLAEFHGLRYEEATNPRDLDRLAREGLARPGIDLIRVPVDRQHDLEMRAQLDG